MSLRLSWLGTVVVFAVLAGRSNVAGEAAPRPNILFLFADDQRADTIGAWGNRHVRTPNIDRLAARGTSFRANYCFGSNSGAVCMPSRAMLMSGRTWFDVPLNLGGAPVFPQILREQGGYDTFATGKWHNGEASFTRAFPEGRSILFGGMADHTKVPIADVRDGEVVDRRIASKFSCVEFADEAIRFIESRAGAETPFLCYVAFTTPHDPRNPPEAYRERFYADPPPLPANYRPLPAFDNGMAIGVRDEDLAPYPRASEVIRDQLCEYYGLIELHDEQVGRILEALQRSGHSDDTIVIYTADHGLALGSHGLLGKQSVYEHSMRSPLIIAVPGVPGGQATDAFTYLYDLTPTICELAGVAPPPNCAGESLRPIWTGERTEIRDSVFLPFQRLMRSVRDDRWKLILYPPINRVELFDLVADPHETRDLSSEPDSRAQIERLEALMRDWQARVGDDLPLRVEKPASGQLNFEGYVRKPDRWQPDWIIKKYFRTTDSKAH